MRKARFILSTRIRIGVTARGTSLGNGPKYTPWSVMGRFDSLAEAQASPQFDRLRHGNRQVKITHRGKVMWSRT